MSPNCRSHEAEDGREQSEAPVHGNQDCKRIRSIRDTPPPLRRMPRRTQSATAMACQLETWQPNYEANGPLYKIRSHLAGFDRASPSLRNIARELRESRIRVCLRDLCLYSLNWPTQVCR